MSVDIASLPLVLAGPILRRVTNVEVNVWIAMRDARDVTLQLFEASTSTPAGTATASSQRVGDHLHVALVTLSDVSLTSSDPSAPRTPRCWGPLHDHDVVRQPVGELPSPAGQFGAPTNVLLDLSRLRVVRLPRREDLVPAARSVRTPKGAA